MNLKIIQGSHSQYGNIPFMLFLLQQDYFTAGVVEHRVVPPTNCMQVGSNTIFTAPKRHKKMVDDVQVAAKFHWA